MPDEVDEKSDKVKWSRYVDGLVNPPEDSEEELPQFTVDPTITDAQDMHRRLL